jgi:hypothetical protein
MRHRVGGATCGLYAGDGSRVSGASDGLRALAYGSKRRKQEQEKSAGEGADKSEAKSQDKAKEKSSKEGSGGGSPDS